MPILVFIPSLSVLALTLASLLPWGGGDLVRFTTPLIPLLALHYWGLRRPRQMPAAVAFLAGLVFDVVSNGPVGFWALMFLAALGMARVGHDLAIASGPIGRCVLAVIMIATIVVIEWSIGSIYFLRQLDWRPLILSGAIACLLYPLVAVLLWPFDRLWERPNVSPFQRGN